jgi:putative glutamine amidotransferase
MVNIGISPCFMYPDSGRTVFGPKTLNYLEKDMGRYLAREHILPVLIPDVTDEILWPILEQMHGFVFQGGSDVAPQTYGEKPIGIWKGDPHRDTFELKIMDFAIKNAKPVFGICRGFQLMNIYFGGTLYQDIATQRPGANLHRSAELYDTIKHRINFVSGSYLDELYNGVEHPYVNTVHHQAVKSLGKDLEVFATSDDDLIEAFGYTKEPPGKVVGVQWHPEFSDTLADEVINADKLYMAFLEHVKLNSIGN